MKLSFGLFLLSANFCTKSTKAVRRKKYGNRPQLSLIGIQTADLCQIKRTITGDKTSYQLLSDTVNDDTSITSGSPILSTTTPTSQFIDDFDKIVGDSPPIAELLMRTKDSGQFVGLFVDIKDANIDNGGVLTYDIRQSPNQIINESSLENSLENIFVGTDSDTVAFYQCSYQMTNWSKNWATCPMCKLAIPEFVNTDGELSCDEVCRSTLEVLGGGSEDLYTELVAVSCPGMCEHARGRKEIGRNIFPEKMCEEKNLCDVEENN